MGIYHWRMKEMEENFIPPLHWFSQELVIVYVWLDLSISILYLLRALIAVGFVFLVLSCGCQCLNHVISVEVLNMWTSGCVPEYISVLSHSWKILIPYLTRLSSYVYTEEYATLKCMSCPVDGESFLWCVILEILRSGCLILGEYSVIVYV
jgi:hypothetical protein